MNYGYTILRSKSLGYALCKWNDEALCWQQVTKWYER